MPQRVAIQVDWTSFAPTSTMPASVTANDGTVVSFALTGNTSLLQPGYVGNIRTGTRGALTDYMALGMRGARNGAGVTLTEERDLWDMPIILILLLGLLGVEWGVRRVRGYV